MAKRSEQARRVLEVLNARQADAGTGKWFDHILDALPAGSELDPDTLLALESHLRGGYGSEYLKIGSDFAEHLRFWKTLAGRFPENPKLGAIYADTLLIGGHIPEAMDEFLRAFEREPTLLYEFGGELYDYMKQMGGRRWLGYRLTTVRAAMAEASGNGDTIRQQLEDIRREFMGDPEAMREIAKLASEASRK